MNFFGPKNVACSQNSRDSGRLLHPCSVVSVPCALDQAIVVHDPHHRPVSCFTVYLGFWDWERFLGYAVLEVDRYGGRSVIMWVSIYLPQWQNATLHHSGLPNWPTLQGWDCVPPHPKCSASHGTKCHTLQDNSATPHRAQVITDLLPPTLQIWLQSIFGQRVAKNYLTPVDVYQLTRVLQQVWQSKLFRPSSSPQVCAA